MAFSYVNQIVNVLNNTQRWSKSIEKDAYQDLVAARTAKTVLSYFGVLMGLKLVAAFKSSMGLFKIAMDSSAPDNVNLYIASGGMFLGGLVSIAFTPLYLLVASLETIFAVRKAKFEALQGENV